MGALDALDQMLNGKRKGRQGKPSLTGGRIGGGLIPDISFSSPSPTRASPSSINQSINGMRGMLNDIDDDGVPDLIDCEPFNPFKQDKLNKTQMRRLYNLPIYFTDSSQPTIELAYAKKHYHHISEKRMPLGAYKAKKRFLAMVQRHPGIIGEIERKNPTVLVYTPRTIKYQEAKAQGRTSISKKGAAVSVAGAPGKRLRDIANVKSKRAEELRKKLGKKRYTVGRGVAEQSAQTTYHELEHVRQAREEDMDEIIDKEKYGQLTTGKEAPGYYDIPAESMAEEHGEEMREKRYRENKKGVDYAKEFFGW